MPDQTNDPIPEMTAAPVPLTRAQRYASVALAAALLLLGLYTLRNFLDALAWAGIFAIALWPLYRRAQAQFGPNHHKLTLPLLFTIGVALIFILPLGLVGIQLARESESVGAWLRNAQDQGIAEPAFLRHLPFGSGQVDAWWQDNLADPGSARELVQRSTRGHVADIGRIVIAQVARRITVGIFTLLTLFFLFKDGDAVICQFRRAILRAFGPGGERVGRQIVVSVHGTVNGLVLVGLGVGLAMGIIYAVADVPEPVVFGMLTAIAAMIPFAAPAVFLIAALLLVAADMVARAIMVFAIGMAVTFTADHFIRPTLIGGATKLPFLWVLLGILGGVEVWGLIGLFLGPAVMAALVLLWREWAGDGSS